MKEEIKHAAVKAVNGFVCLGMSHADCFYQGRSIGLKMSSKASAQGFFTNKGRYVERKKAATIAKRAKQLDPADKRFKKLKYLLSEDIWHQSDVIYCQTRGYCKVRSEQK